MAPSNASSAASSPPDVPPGASRHPLSKFSKFYLRGRPYHWAGELLAVTDVRFAVQPDLGQLGDVLEAEGIKLEGCPACLPILMHKNGVVCGTPVLCVKKQCQTLTCE